MKKFNTSLQNSILSLVGKKYKAFTLAEILLSLTVIGIVAAIALPSLLGNANERAWETQKKALYTRFSQALPLLPSLNGYGELVGNLSDCADTNSCHSDSELKDTAAETFVRDGLSKVMKITNICDNEHLADCGLPDKIIPINGNTISVSSIKSIGAYNNMLLSATINPNTSNEVVYQEHLDTKAVAFEMVNGESILVYYNPNCEPDLEENPNDWNFTQSKMCANFIYDLNGKKGPNTVGKDIGFITALYSINSSIVAPILYSYNNEDNFTYAQASAKCKEINVDTKIPSIDEMTSIFYNWRILGITRARQYWSSTSGPTNKNWVQDTHYGRRAAWNRSSEKSVLCIKR